jgi:type II secretory pathway pseudopilin PulG
MTARRRQPGFALLPVVLTLAVIAVVSAVLLERGAVESQIRDNRQRADSLTYAAQAGYAHARALLGRWSGCAGLPTLPATSFGQAAYSATMTPGATAASATYSFVTVADAWLESGAVTAAHGLEKDLKVKTKAGDIRRSVLAFDLSGMPANTEILSATLDLHVKNDDHTGDPVKIYRVTSAWSEATVTWSNASANHDAAWLQASFTPLSTGPISVDITRLVRAWTDGALPNFGVYLVATSNDEESVYASREEGDPTKHPRVVVTTRPRVHVAVAAQATSSDGAQRTVAASADGPATSALFLDYFDAAYAGNDGTRNWTGDWQEIGESDGPGSGAVRAISSTTCAYGGCLRLDAGLLSNVGASREANVVGVTSAVLRVDTRRDGGNWTLQVSGDGGGSWQTLKSAAAGTDSSQVRDSFNVSAYATANMRIRFMSSQLLGLGTKDVYIDNVEIEAICTP